MVASGEPLFLDAAGRTVRQCARFQLVGEAASGREVLALLPAADADVAVLGPALGAVDAPRILRLVAAERLRTRLLYVTDAVDPAGAYDLLGAGAAGFVTRTTSQEQLRDAILAVGGGRAFLCGDMQTALVGEIRLRMSDDRPVLSDREREILCRMAAGESVPTMGRRMHLSPSTVKTHVHHLYEKLAVSDRAAAVAAAMRRGLIA